MDKKQFKQLEKDFYQELKISTKARKIKLSAEHDIYKKEGQYFYNAFYWLEDIKNDYAYFTLYITVKYHRFDELQYGIIHPENQLRFTDKLRANSGVLCHATIAHIRQKFKYNNEEEPISKLCEALLNFLKDYCTDFLNTVEKEYGDLNGYYIAHKKENPRLAGLAYLDTGNYDGAIECFKSNKMDGKNDIWISNIQTDEQRQRAEENSKKSHVDNSFLRNRKEQFLDYAIALKNGLEWNYDRAMFGLLKSERKTNLKK